MKIGFTNGCFDLFHEGHVHMLTECLNRCDYLIVAVNSDDWIKRHKGQNRPRDGLQTRMLNVAVYAHSVIPFEGNKEGLIMAIRPDIVFKGYDHGKDGATSMAIRKPGWKDCPLHEQWDMIQVAHIPHLPGFSTSESIHATQRNAQPRP